MIDIVTLGDFDENESKNADAKCCPKGRLVGLSLIKVQGAGFTGTLSWSLKVYADNTSDADRLLAEITITTPDYDNTNVFTYDRNSLDVLYESEYFYAGNDSTPALYCELTLSGSTGGPSTDYRYKLRVETVQSDE